MLQNFVHASPQIWVNVGRPNYAAGARAGLLLCLLVGCIGCSRAPFGPPGYPAPGQFPQVNATPIGQPGFVQRPATGPGSVFAQQQTNPQLLESQRRIQQLDNNNRQLTTQNAQAQQQLQAYKERAELLARQLQDATNQNKQLLASTQQYANQARGMQAAMTVRGGARLTANNSLSQSATGLQIAGARVLPDGDLIRIRIPADQLFAPGSAQSNPAGAMLLGQVANALTRRYQRQRVGIEGHTDMAGMYGGSTQFQLAGAQAQAVMDQLVRRYGVPTRQLFVIAHGPNHAIADNGSPAGRAENRRIEFVIYPETF